MKAFKKPLALILAIAMAFTLFIGADMTVSADSEGIYEYSVLNNDEVAIVACNPSASGEITIPDTLGGYPVTTLEANSFANCTEITGITIPAGVNFINEGIFNYCEKLATIKVASGNTTYYSKGNCIIKTDTGTIVAGCYKSVIPTDNSVTSIGTCAFYGCKELKSITIPKNITSIGNTAFGFCSALKNVVIEDGLLSIEVSAFYSCNELSTIAIPKSLTFVGGMAFYGCGFSIEVYYAGSKSQWEKITFEECNDCVQSGQISYNTDPTVKYKLTYELGGGTGAANPATYTVISDDITLKNPKKTGYTFDGWYNGSVKVTVIPKGTKGDITLTAKWSKNKYTVSYVLNGGTNAKNPTTYKYNDADIVLKNPTRKGYSFKGWYNGSTKVTKIAKGTNKNITLTAKWSKNTYTITYKLAGGKKVKNPASYTVTTSAITLKNPTKKGYTFAGWYNGSKKIKTIKKGSAGDITLTAKWTAIKYKITYKLNSGKNNSKNPKSYKITTSTIKLNSPTRKGYNFKGWYDNAKFKGKKITTITKGSTGDMTLYAKWAKKK